MTGPLDGPRQSTLVLRTIAGDPSADDFPLLRKELAETFHIFIINQSYFFTAETADLLSKKAAPGGASLSLASPWG